MGIQRYLLSFFALVVLVLFADFFVSHNVESDETLPYVKEFIESSAKLEARFGHIDKLEVKKFTKVSATNQSPAYKLYAIYIMGEDDSGLIEVKALLKSDASEIDSIKLGR